MSMFRSDRMGFYNLMMPREYSWEVVNELGQLDCLQFIDLNKEFNRPYMSYVKRCLDLEEKITKIEAQMTRFEEPIERCLDPKVFLHDLKMFLLSRNKAERTYFDDLESFIDEKFTQMNDQIQNYDNLIDNYNHLIQFKQVLLQTRPYIGDREFRAQNVAEAGLAEEAKTDILARGNIKFSYLTGVIDREEAARFKKILFRVTRGMAWTAIMDIAKPKNPEKEYNTYFKEGGNEEAKPKSVFLIVYQGGSFDMMKGKLNRICESFGASTYRIPEDPQAFLKETQQIEDQIREAQNVINITEGAIKHMLNYFSQPRIQNLSYSLIEDIRLFLLKEKAIYHNLNTLKSNGALYQGSCWCPKEISDKVRQTITELKRRKPEIGGCDFQEAPFPHNMNAPTHYRLNDFTWVFQQIVNTYGTPRYREINPGLFTIATFPFLFGVMFGDIGHGGILLAFGAYLCLFKENIEKDRKSMLAGILPARYLFLLQGFMACYCGFIYNDFMAMPWNLFGSCYENTHEVGPVPRTGSDCVYPVGIDPGWYGVTNELTFLNSFKMKMSIVLGVIQMLFGLALRSVNNFHFNHWLELIFEFFPMFIFMSLTFGYMVILIILKWFIPWGTPEHPASEAPSIIGIFIKMALEPGKWNKAEMGQPLYGDSDGTYQASVQKDFLIVAVVCALLILIPKPIILWLKSLGNPKKKPAGYVAQHDEPNVREKLLGDNAEGEGQGQGQGQEAHEVQEPHEGHVVQRRDPEEHVDPSGHGHGEFEFGDVFVHQVIETIEFVLGSISNTASYLRLWALSLAHSQLAKVFYDNTIGSSIVSGNFMGAFIGFVFFAQVTFGVLLCMDQMECFLHALRLHWVEFNSKFFKADGYPFEPLSFEKIFKDANA